ncbi:MAG: hypothetical protein EOM21_15890 [Gammaproteobacteria bacterium]|nr:hypothetical protein [Gammaproteobacteria bacterium]
MLSPVMLLVATNARKLEKKAAARDAAELRANARKVGSELGFLRVTVDGYDLGSDPDPDRLLPTVTGSRPVASAVPRKNEKRAAAARAAWAKRRAAAK